MKPEDYVEVKVYVEDHGTITNKEIESFFMSMLQVINQNGPDLVEILGSIYIMKILMNDGAVLPMTLDLRNFDGSLTIGLPMARPSVIVSTDEQTFLDVLNNRISPYEALN